VKATIVDLRYRMKDVLRAIDRGEAVTVLYRGKERARLVPVSAQQQELPDTASQEFFGMWKDRREMVNPASYIRKMRRQRSAKLGISSAKSR
jgi:antitoxin (DNA-binding transcriptional repressor) of toxin-antitoxin stability system